MNMKVLLALLLGSSLPAFAADTDMGKPKPDVTKPRKPVQKPLPPKPDTEPEEEDVQ